MKQIRRATAWMLCAAMLMGPCAAAEEEGTPVPETAVLSEVSTPEPTKEPTPEPTKEPTPEPTPEPTK